MRISPNNRMVEQIFESIADSQDNLQIIGNDYDGMTYKIEKDADKNQIKLSFAFDTYNEIIDLIGEWFYKTYYGDCKRLKPAEEEYHMTFVIDINALKKAPEIPKNCTPEEKIELRKQRKNINRENKAFLLAKQDQFSKMRRNFFASPFEFTFEQIAKGKLIPLCFGSKPDERIWIIPNEKGTLSVYYAFNFKDPLDNIICSIIFSEFDEVRRHVNDAPSFQYFKDLKKLPESFTKVFPEVNSQLKEKSLLLAMTLFDSHLKDQNKENTASLLQGFRQFVHYHIHASKTYLHGKIRKKTMLALKQINLTKYDVEDIKTYRGRKGKGTTVNLMVDEDEDDGSNVVLRG